MGIGAGFQKTYFNGSRVTKHIHRLFMLTGSSRCGHSPESRDVGNPHDTGHSPDPMPTAVKAEHLSVSNYSEGLLHSVTCR